MFFTFIMQNFLRVKGIYPSLIKYFITLHIESIIFWVFRCIFNISFYTFLENYIYLFLVLENIYVICLVWTWIKKILTYTFAGLRENICNISWPAINLTNLYICICPGSTKIYVIYFCLQWILKIFSLKFDNLTKREIFRNRKAFFIVP